MATVNDNRNTWAYMAVKRLLDLVLGSILLAASLPVIIFVAIVIRIESRGNPFFLQKRMGLHGEPFTIFKLRGMWIDARERFPELYDYSKYSDLKFNFHYQNDPRVTRVGSFTRRTSIDELPNFLNVVLGTMTLVGPRPEVPEVLDLYCEYQSKYISVRPGITCLSKVSGRDFLTKEDTIKVDIQYIDTMNLSHDLSILWRTFLSVIRCRDVFGRGAGSAKMSAQTAEVPEAKETVSRIRKCKLGLRSSSE